MREPRKTSAGSIPAVSLSVLLLLAAWTGTARAVDAYVQLKGKSNAMYISNLEIQYATSHAAVAEVVTVIPEQLKYEKYPFADVRSIEFLEIVGEKDLSPVYTAKISLRRPGMWRQTRLMPIRELRGQNFGAPWTFPLDSGRGYEDNAEALQEIRFIPPRPGK
ncbi:MAG: hypothetical protein GYA47_02830 [Desulfovibrio sp.]|nr:hypothetical protein [Desulfovibrio sp.]